MSRELRDDALAIYRAGLKAADPATLLETQELPAPPAGGRLRVFGAGKAAAHVAAALERRLEGRDYDGRIIVKYDHAVPLSRIAVEEGGHPLPDAKGLEATGRLLARLDGGESSDRIVFLLTGGASALLVSPYEGLELDDKIAVTDRLLRCGATIQELNCVRKHLSAVKGGRLLERMAPARVVTLAISDVIGDDLSSIGSGPTTGDPSTFQDAWAIVERYDLVSTMPARVVSHLRRGVAGDVPETPKPRDPLFESVEHVILASNRNSLSAVSAEARRLGFETVTFAEDMVGSVHEQATSFAKALAKARDSSRRTALLAGGELTLEVTGRGVGGRCQEFVLVAARELAGCEGVCVLAAGTDGGDGPTDAAGAWADGGTWELGAAQGVDPAAHLADNDAYHFFEALGALLKTGPTGTNVNDLMVGLAVSNSGG